MASSSLSFLSPSLSSPNPSTPILSFSLRPPISLSVRPIGRSERGERGRLWTAAAATTGKKYRGTVMREEKLTEMIEKKVAEAMEACDGEEAKGSDGCKVAWDEVEEVSQAKADLRRKIAESDSDPLQSFCEDHPETEECRIYDD